MSLWKHQAQFLPFTTVFAIIRTVDCEKKPPKIGRKTKHTVETIQSRRSRALAIPTWQGATTQFRVRYFHTLITLERHFNVENTCTFTFSGFSDIFHVINHFARWQTHTFYSNSNIISKIHFVHNFQPDSDLYNWGAFRSLPSIPYPFARSLRVRQGGRQKSRFHSCELIYILIYRRNV